MTFEIGDRVRRRVDGERMIIIGYYPLETARWQCAWMDRNVRFTANFTGEEITQGDVIDGEAHEIKPLRIEDIKRVK